MTMITLHETYSNRSAHAYCVHLRVRWQYGRNICVWKVAPPTKKLLQIYVFSCHIGSDLRFSIHTSIHSATAIQLLQKQRTLALHCSMGNPRWSSQHDWKCLFYHCNYNRTICHSVPSILLGVQTLECQVFMPGYNTVFDLI